MSTVTGTCTESVAKMLFEQGLQQQNEQQVKEKFELQQQEQATHPSSTTAKKSASPASESTEVKDGFVGTQIDVYV